MSLNKFKWLRAIPLPAIRSRLPKLRELPKKKYFHELTKAEFKQVIDAKLTWAECAKRYPQPPWCHEPDAVCGEMGCWSLMGHMIRGQKDCQNCEAYEPASVGDKELIK